MVTTYKNRMSSNSKDKLASFLILLFHQGKEMEELRTRQCPLEPAQFDKIHYIHMYIYFVDLIVYFISQM